MSIWIWFKLFPNILIGKEFKSVLIILHNLCISQQVPSIIDECHNIYEEKKIGEKNLEYFRQKLPVFNFIGKTKFISSNIPFNIKTEDQIVFKYLKAYTLGWIDLGYQVCGEEESLQEKSWREAFCSAIEKTFSEWIIKGKFF